MTTRRNKIRPIRFGIAIRPFIIPAISQIMSSFKKAPEATNGNEDDDLVRQNRFSA